MVGALFLSQTDPLPLLLITFGGTKTRAGQADKGGVSHDSRNHSNQAAIGEGGEGE